MHPSLESNMLYQLKDVIHNFITQVANLRVAVIGETIKDEFIPVIYEGQSMKSFCPVLKKTEDHILVQEGGAKAIANHIKDFVKEVHVYSNPIDEIVKSRYIDVNDQKKYIEINRFNLNNEPISVQCSNYDVVIVADFGHGFCDRLSIDDGFHLMCQTNSNNFGFNRVSKWKKHQKNLYV
jgi:bifunctional ADP-heptose synthase (sugar kinase/adenylyltransferase)